MIPPPKLRQSPFSTPIHNAVLGYSGSPIAFRVGPEDVADFTKELYPVFDFEDVLNLPSRQLQCEADDRRDAEPSSVRLTS